MNVVTRLREYAERYTQLLGPIVYLKEVLWGGYNLPYQVYVPESQMLEREW